MVTLFFDRSVGRRLPEALRLLRLPVGIEYHQQHFAQTEHDDIWLPLVGAWGWYVVGQDWSYHIKVPELSAIKQYHIGCFYLWGAEEKVWETMRCFARGYDRILNAASSTPGPFIYRVSRAGRLSPVPIP